MADKQPITVLLADDHALLRGALQHCLNGQPDIRVVATAATADAAVTEAIRLQPDVILMDIDMPGLSCFEAVQALKVRCPETRVAFLSAFHNDNYIERAIEVRAWGYIVKNEPTESVLKAIRDIADGITYFSPEIQKRIILTDGTMRLPNRSVSPASRLSRREMEVLRLLARGLSHEDIAASLSISRHTVHRHAVSIRRKLNIHDRVELARYAIREGLAEA
jgi:DNA-binding NarL/FixJ family response regulator